MSHHEQPAVSVRLMVRAGGAQDPADKPGVAALAAALLDQGTTSQTAEQIAARHRFDRRRPRRRRRHRILTFVQRDRHEGQLRRRRWTWWPTSRSNPAFAPEEIERQRSRCCRRSPSATTIRNTSPASCSSGSSTVRTATAGRIQARRVIARGDHARRSGRVSPGAGSAPNNAILAIVGDVTAGGGVRRG